MPTRLNIMAILAVLLILILLTNGQRVQFQFFFVTTQLPLGSLMAACLALGVGLTFLFLSLGRSYKKLIFKIKKHSSPS